MLEELVQIWIARQDLHEPCLCRVCAHVRRGKTGFHSGELISEKSQAGPKTERKRLYHAVGLVLRIFASSATFQGK
eukprot:6195112-Pleurochrysis_carterae.AAC.3